jgi:exodeoxyribonuclease-3
MRIVTLNIRHGGGRRGEVLAAFLKSLRPDLVVLTEFRRGATGGLLQSRLSEFGLTAQASAATRPAQNSVCIASAVPMEIVPFPALPGDEHRLLMAKIGELRLIAAYFPQEEAKRPVFEHLRVHGIPALSTLGVIMGDLNTGMPFQDEAGQTFFCADAFADLLRDGMVDAWRMRNPAAREFTWYSARGNGFRIDHALCTPALDRRIQAIAYMHQCREERITDHSALMLDLTL